MFYAVSHYPDRQRRFSSLLRIPLQQLADQGKGQCLGAQGVNLLMSALQNRLIDHGYVTARVMAPPQNLKTGTLHITLIEQNAPDRIGQRERSLREPLERHASA